MDCTHFRPVGKFFLPPRFQAYTEGGLQAKLDSAGVGSVAAGTLVRAKELLTAKRFSEALELFQESANSGNAEGQRYVGDMYMNGLGVMEDYTQARHWYETGAAAGNAPAIGQLGYLYQHGLGVARDYVQARQWFEKAANHP